MNPRDVTRPSRTAPMIGRRLLVAGVLALMVTACSGDDDTSPATTIAPPTTEPATTTEATPPPPPTAPETTQSAPATTPPTLPAEPTTTATSAPPNETQIKQDVIDATIASWTALNDVKLDPADDLLVAAFAATLAGGALDRAVEFVTDLRLKNRRSVVHPTMPSMIQVLPGSVIVDRTSGSATIEYCWLNSNLLVEIGANEDGTDMVVNDSVTASHDREHLDFVDGRWLKSGGEVLERYEALQECVDTNAS